MWHTHDGMGWWMMFGGGMWLLVIVLVVVAVLYIRAGGFQLDHRERPDAALDIARQRYARGEISREEFELIRRDLESPGTHGRTSDPA